MKPILGYWDSRGVAEPIRILLHYLEVDFEDKRYFLPDPPTPDLPYDKSDWLKDRDNLGLLYPNLPYYLDGDFKVTQSLAILRYLSRKYDLMPKDEAEIIRTDTLEQQTRDFIGKFSTIFYHPDYDVGYKGCLASLPQSLEYFSRALGDRKWFVHQNEDKLSHVDFQIWEALDRYKLLFADQINSYENLAQFSRRFEDIPTIKKYVTSDKFKNTRMFRFTAKSP